ncbi:MAG TPA: putative metal-binding motif-containing protein, partial [bacterium]|nr:putative metal-binding motif-containing protein [bacterium]
MKKNATMLIALFLLFLAACDGSSKPSVDDNGGNDELTPESDKTLPETDTTATDDAPLDGDSAQPEDSDTRPEGDTQPDEDEAYPDEVIPDEMVDEAWDGGDEAMFDDMTDEDIITVPDVVESEDDTLPFDDETPDTNDIFPDQFDAFTGDDDILLTDTDELVTCEDDGQDCTEEVVLNDQCLHLPRHELCDAAEMCNPADGCVSADGWLCRSCAGGLPCAYPTDVCASLLGTSVCLTACVSDDECLPSFSCLDIYDEEDNFLGRGCKPDSQICCVDFDGDMAGVGAMCQLQDCDETDPDVRPGMTELCNGIDDDCSGTADDNLQSSAPFCLKQQGVCFGSRQSCGGMAGWLPCGTGDYLAWDGRYETVEATCDLADNDCNNQIDEPFEAVLYKSCTEGFGICERSGFTVCNDPGNGVICNAEPGPKDDPEKCNNLDDDCDDVIDNGFPKKNTVCTDGYGVCRVTGIYVCNTDGSDTECNVKALPSTDDEDCDGLDNDCNDAVDDGLTGGLCPNQKGVCAGTRQSCGGFSGWLPCGPTEYANQTNGTYEQNETICDGKNNDCDDETDENMASYAPTCPLQNGVCKGSRMACGGLSGWLACTAANYGPEYEATETQCDYLDNDCDTQVDEGYKNQVTGKYDQNTACGNCSTDCTAIYNKPNGYGTCNATSSPVCWLTCNVNYYNLNNVPDDGCEFLLETSVIYVSTSNGTNDTTCGLGPSGTVVGYYPCKTIAYGITRAQATTRTKVYVADGLYEETVTLVNGISLYGGYKADTWERHITSSLTVWRGNESATHKRTVVASGITSATVVEGFVLYGQAATAAGGNSYALYMSNSNSSLTIKDNIIYAGNGGPGTDGLKGADGSNGVNGIAGQNTIETNTYDKATCDALSTTPGNQGTPGDGGQRTCGATAVHGGAGAGAVCPSGNSMQPTGIAGNSGGVGGGSGGAGGAGGYDRNTTNCGTFGTGGFSATANPGADGGSGGHAVAVLGCSVAAGSVSGGDWTGSSAVTGNNGTPGGGGGGGGAGGGADVSSNCTGTDDCLGG